MLVIFARTLILYFLVVLVMRLMGKRQIGQLQPFELVVAIMISNLAAVPMQDRDLPLATGIIPILTLLVAQVSLAFLSLRSQSFRRLLCGTPSILKKRPHSSARTNQPALQSERPARAAADQKPAKPEDVEFGILETNGSLSVIPKSQRRPLNPADLNLSTKYEGLPLNLVVDGNVNRENLRRAGLDEDWLRPTLPVRHGRTGRGLLRDA